MESALSTLLFSGIKLMLIGMSIVFLFLALLVWVIGITSRLLQRYSPPEPDSRVAQPMAAGADTAFDEAELVAVISAAIHRYENP